MPTFLENRSIRRTAFKQALKDLRPLAKVNANKFLVEQRQEAAQAMAVRAALIRKHKTEVEPSSE